MRAVLAGSVIALTLSAGALAAQTPPPAPGPAASERPRYPRQSERPIPPPPAAPVLASEELRRYPAEEAGQGAAAAGDSFYAIVNTRIGRYSKATGERTAEWSGDRTRFVHINACSVIENELVCAHSNFPHVPMQSSIEVFDPATLEHRRSVSLGEQIGSLTWVDRRDGHWWAGFANYDERGGEPGRDHRYAAVARFDDQWRRMESYAFPPEILDRFAPTSTSGGAWGDDGLLYVTGHDAREVYVLRLPDAGSMLVHVATVSVGFEGQGWAWDPTEGRTIWSISRPNRQVVVTRIPEIPEPR